MSTLSGAEVLDVAAGDPARIQEAQAVKRIPRAPSE